MRKTQDERGTSLWDCVEELPGQVNISVTTPGQKRGFHLHKHKTDHWIVAAGTLLVVMTVDCRDWEIKVVRRGDKLVIEPDKWHAYQNIGDSEAILVYYETAKSGVDRADDAEMPLNNYHSWEK